MNAPTKLLILILTLAMAAAACGTTYDRDEAIADLVAGGLTQPQASCVIDGVEANFSLDRLESRGSLTAEEEAVLTDVTLDCVLSGGASNGGESTAGGDTAGDDATDIAAPATTTTLFGAGDFEPACRGVGIAAAAPYVAGDGLNHVVALTGEAPSYSGYYGSALADGWEADWEVIDRTELVVCMNRTSSVAGELCTGYADEDSGIEWDVQTYGATYEINLVEAQTAAVVATTTLEASPGDCPFFSSYFEGDPTPKPDYASPDDELQAWLAPYIQG